MSNYNKFWCAMFISVLVCAYLALAAGYQNIPSHQEREMITSGYCPCSLCCGDQSPRITASGHLIKPGDSFAAGPSDIPFYTMVSVPGYNDDKPIPVLDRGGAIVNNRLDVFFPTHEEATNWGIKVLLVKIYFL